MPHPESHANLPGYLPTYQVFSRVAFVPPEADCRALESRRRVRRAVGAWHGVFHGAG